jgi:hypothetical protein
MATRRTTDLAGAARAVDALVARLSDPQEIAAAIGTATASAINAQGARTSSPPQAKAVAGAFDYQGDAIHLNAYDQAGRGVAGDLIWGSEFGSDRYTQFGPRHSGGTWIFPILRQLPKPVISAGDDAVDDLIGDAI